MSRHSPDVWIGDDAIALAREGVRRVAEAARRAIAARGRFTLVLSGGNTPRRMYRALAADEYGIEWGRVEFFFSDERMVPPEHPDSNYGMARETLLGHIPIRPEQVHRVPTELPVTEAARAYEAVLRAVLDPKEPHLDFVVLGMGPDGHTASIFPGSPLVTRDFTSSEPSQVTRAARSYATEPLSAAVLNAPRPPRERVTLAPYIINQARQVMVMVAGEDKVAAVSAALESDAEASEIPIRAIAPDNGLLSWLLDRKAARALTNAPF